MSEDKQPKSKKRLWPTVKRGVCTAAGAVARAVVAFGRHTAAVFRPHPTKAADPFAARYGHGVAPHPIDSGATAKPTGFTRAHWIAAVVMVAAMGACTAALWVGSLWKIADVTVEGCAYYAPAAVAEQAGVTTGDEFLGVDTWVIEGRIKEAFPLIERVKVSKHLNGDVTVSVTEYADLYYTCHNQNYYVLSAADLTVLEIASDGDAYRGMGATYIGFPAEARVRVGEPLTYAYLPFADGEAETLYDTRAEDPNEEYAYVANAIGIVLAWAQADRVTGMELTDRYAMYIVLDGRIKITVGKSTDLARKLDLAARILETECPEGTAPVILDVSHPDTASIREDAAYVLPDWARS